MGKPFVLARNPRKRMQTLGSKTFQYQEEKRLISIPQVAASENGEAQTFLGSNVEKGVVRQELHVYMKKVKKLFVRRSFWKEAPQRVIVP